MNTISESSSGRETAGQASHDASYIRHADKRRPYRGFSILVLLLALAAHADVTVAPIFGDHMVLQRDRPVPVWGKADPGEQVTVGFADYSGSVTADASGQWRVNLGAMPASAEPRVLTVRGKNTLTFSDVLVGEVWFCSGQSNMEKPLGPRSGQKPTDDYEEELKRAGCPTLRLFQVPQHARPKQDDGTMAWFPSAGDALLKTKFSAAAYYFGRELERELGVPIGLIHSSFGGTRIEAWMPAQAFDTAELRELPQQTYQAWVKGVQATELYQSMVTPFVPFALRGFLWYQGEANVMNAESDLYALKMRAMIETWRAAWGIADAPFYFAQLAPFFYSGQKNWVKQLTPLALPAIWEAQVRVLDDVPFTAIIPTSDLAGNGRDIHPTNKRDVGLRFARLALADTYGHVVLAQAPRFKSFRRLEGPTIEITFDHAAGLHTPANLPPAEFEIAGEDRVFHPAGPAIMGDRVVLWSPHVAEPVAVRFAWHELAMPNLMNVAGLPALPFRTDDWPLVLETPKVPATPATK
jgi:sialate O-acetylesterase